MIRLVRQTNPSGALIDIAYDSAGRPLEIRVNGQVLISDIVYQPFGAPKTWACMDDVDDVDDGVMDDGVRSCINAFLHATFPTWRDL